jgi:hypothetical protein
MIPTKIHRRVPARAAGLPDRFSAGVSARSGPFFCCCILRRLSAGRKRPPRLFFRSYAAFLQLFAFLQFFAA